MTRDADDLLETDKISKQLAKGEKGHSSKILLSSSFGKFFYRREKAKFDISLLWRDLTPVEWLVTKFNNNIWMNPAVWLVSRKLIEIAGTWDERLSLDDDGEYFCRVVAASETTEFIRSAKSFYRQVNLSSISRLKTNKACESLLLSLQLCCRNLLSLEDSERTRKACFNYLQTWYPYFYTEKNELTRKIETIAESLGGKLYHPEVSWKYHPINKFFGYTCARNTMNAWNNIKTQIFKCMDKAIYQLNKKIF